MPTPIFLNNNFSEWCEILLGVSQGWILGFILFNIFDNYMSYFIQEAYTGNFVDYNLLFSIDGNFTEEWLENAVRVLTR